MNRLLLVDLKSNQSDTGKCAKLVLISADIRICLKLVRRIIAGRKQLPLELELENAGLTVFTSGTAGTLLIFSVLILNAAECQSKALLDSMERQQLWKREICAIHKEYVIPLWQ